MSSILCSDSQLNQTSGIRYISLQGNVLEINLSAAQTVIPFDGTIDQFYLNAISVASTANSTVTLNKNGSDTSLSVTITASTPGVYSDTSNSVSVVAGDKVAWKLSQATTGKNYGLISCRFTPS